MHLQIRIKKHSAREILYYLFLVLCFIPFLFPNPVVKTNIQPYAAILGTFVFLFHHDALFNSVYGRNTAVILGGTFIVSLIVMLFSGISVESIRGIYNYFALFIVPCAVFIVLEELSEFPENLCKTMIILWFAVASIQFFVYRGFATQLISSVRWSFKYRGVVGLASEPSFLGITSFYFLHIVRKFRTQRFLYSALVLLMGILYAQSATGVIFIAGYYVVFLFDMINNKKGLYAWTASIIALVVFFSYLNTKLANTRLNQMLDAFFNGGIDSVLSDGSASIRFNAISKALTQAAGNLFLPNGFGSRIGSAYGGLLVELGFFAVPAILFISYGFCLTFQKLRSRILYYLVVTVLLLNNTQIGNPLLLMVIGMNIYYHKSSKSYHRMMEYNAKLYQSK